MSNEKKDEKIEEVISFLKQRSEEFIKKPSKKVILMKYDRHGENYELIEDELQPIGTSETIRDVILRGLPPDVSNNSNYYGSSDMHLTKVQRVAKAQQAIFEGNKLLKEKGSKLLEEYNVYLQEQNKVLDNNLKKQESENKEVK